MDSELNTLGVQQRNVLELIWQKDGATVQEVLDELNARPDTEPLAYTTILATMQKLERLGWLAHEKSEENNRAYVYKPTRTRSEAIGGSLRAFADTFLDGSKTLLFQHFVDDTGLTETELDEIRTFIRGRLEAGGRRPEEK